MTQGFRRVASVKHLYRDEYDSHNGQASGAHFKKRYLARLARRGHQRAIADSMEADEPDDIDLAIAEVERQKRKEDYDLFMKELLNEEQSENS